MRTHLNYIKKVEKFGPSARKHVFKVENSSITIEEYFKKQGKVLK